MKKTIKILFIFMLLFSMYGCKNDSIKYELYINEEISNQFNLNDLIDYKTFFIIKDQNATTIAIEDWMIDSSNVNLKLPGTYKVTLNYEGLSKDINIVIKAPETINYFIEINQNKSKEITINSSIDLKEFFTIKTQNNQTIEILDDMLDTNLDISKIGSYYLKINYQNLEEMITLYVVEPQVEVTYQIFINESVNTTLDINNESFDFSCFFKIIASNGSTVEVTNDMLDISHINFKLPGDYPLIINYGNETTILIITLIDLPPIITYEIIINQEMPTEFDLTTTNIDFKPYFTIIDSNNNHIDILDSMIDSSPVKFTIAGTYFITITFMEISKELSITIKPDDTTNNQKDLFISEYFEGDKPYYGGTDYNNSKYIEIYNGLGYDVDLSLYSLAIYKNGSLTASFIQPLTGILKDQNVYIVYAPFSADEIKAAGHLASEVAYFNGKAAIALLKNDQIIDLIGVIGEYPSGGGWKVDDYYTTANNTLIRIETVDSPTSIWDPSQWYSCGPNYLYSLGEHTLNYDYDQ